MNNDMILVVDDSKFIAQAYSRVLLDLGYRVLIACDGKTGIFAAESCKPSLILLDMLMPDMDGLEVLRTLKRTPSTTNIPVWVTSSLSEKNSIKLIEEGAVGYFEKGSMDSGETGERHFRNLKEALVSSQRSREPTLENFGAPPPRVDVPVRSARLVQLVHCSAGQSASEPGVNVHL